MKTKAEPKIFRDLTATDLDEMTKDLDREFVTDTYHPMTTEERERWERAKRKTKGGIAATGAKTISIYAEPTLLKRSDILAKRKGLTR